MQATLIGQQFDAESPGELYRNTYKYTDCGPTVGLRYWSGGHPFVKYCDDLRQLGPWATMEASGIQIEAFLVSSIVEGVDQCTDTIEVIVEPLETLRERFDAAVEEVNQQASDIWNETHGCEACGPEDDTGYIAVNPECPECGGSGVVI